MNAIEPRSQQRHGNAEKGSDRKYFRHAFSSPRHGSHEEPSAQGTERHGENIGQEGSPGNSVHRRDEHAEDKRRERRKKDPRVSRGARHDE
jgi:hypothetical protein